MFFYRNHSELDYLDSIDLIPSASIEIVLVLSSSSAKRGRGTRCSCASNSVTYARGGRFHIVETKSVVDVLVGVTVYRVMRIACLRCATLSWKFVSIVYSVLAVYLNATSVSRRFSDGLRWSCTRSVKSEVGLVGDVLRIVFGEDCGLAFDWSL